EQVSLGKTQRDVDDVVSGAPSVREAGGVAVGVPQLKGASAARDQAVERAEARLGGGRGLAEGGVEADHFGEGRRAGVGSRDLVHARYAGEKAGDEIRPGKDRRRLGGRYGRTVERGDHGG